MRYYKIKTGKPVTFNNYNELFITEQIGLLVKKNNLIILEYNICKDHIHFIIVCDNERLEHIVQNIKNVSSRRFHDKKNIENIWAQKFNRKVIDSEEQLYNSISYIQNNRIKHGLDENKKLQSLINRMLTPIEDVIKIFQNEEI